MRLSQKLREQRGQFLDQAKAIQELAANEGRDLNEAEQAAFDHLMAEPTGELAKLDARIKAVEALESKITDSQAIRDAIAFPVRADGPAPVAKPDPNAPRVYSCPRSVPLHSRLRAFRAGSQTENKAMAYAFGQWFLAVHGRQTAAEYCRNNGIPLVRAAMTEGDNAAGGYTVPEEFEQTIIDLRNEYGVARREAQIVPMASDTRSQPKRAGGVTAYFVNENTEITASDKSWENVQLTAKKIGALVKYSSELSEDTVVSMADDLASEIAYAFAIKEDQCLFIGDGTSTYGGMVGLKNALQAGSEYTAVTGNTSFKELDLADFTSMVAKVQGYALTRGNAKWFIHRSAWADSMLRLAEAAGGNTVANVTAGVGPSFLGYPVVFVEAGNNTLTAQTSAEGLLYFGDLRLSAMLGSRRGLTIMTSTDRYFEYDQLAIKGTERFDINVHDRGTASVAGGIVQLLAPGS